VTPSPLTHRGSPGAAPGRALLAVDVGLRTGLALFAIAEAPGGGRLLWYRSRNLGTATRLRRHAPTLLREIDDLACVALEGGGPLAEIWAREAERLGARVLRVTAEAWRKHLLPRNEWTSGPKAKRSAGIRAREVIEASGARRPTSLRHDAAEAILVGVYALTLL
jgi:hypothetical protein